MIVRACILVLTLGWVTATVPQHADAAQRSTAISTRDSAPRLPLASEPPADVPPLAQAAVFVALGFVVGAVVALIFYVRLRERPARQNRHSPERSIGWR